MLYPRWLSLVLRAVGLVGVGDTGVLGSECTGERMDNEGLVFVAAVEILRDNLGLAERASILTECMMNLFGKCLNDR